MSGYYPQNSQLKAEFKKIRDDENYQASVKRAHKTLQPAKPAGKKK